MPLFDEEKVPCSGRIVRLAAHNGVPGKLPPPLPCTACPPGDPQLRPRNVGTSPCPVSTDRESPAQRQILQVRVERIEATGHRLQLAAGMGPIKGCDLEAVLHQLSYHRVIVAIARRQRDAVPAWLPQQIGITADAGDHAGVDPLLLATNTALTFWASMNRMLQSI
jgi:hypothetical protein